MTTQEVQKEMGKYLVMKHHCPVCENVSGLMTRGEMDIVSMTKSGLFHEFEIKISRSDFLADKKKI